MTLDKKTLASRANGLKGGVKTPEGKAVSRMNAVSHGIFTRDVLLIGEDAVHLKELANTLTAELKPVGALETILVQRIITSTWRLKRVLKYELKHTRSISREITGAEDYIAGGNYRDDSWLNFSRYERNIERQIYKAMQELFRVRRERLGAPSSPLTSECETAPSEEETQL